MIHPTALIDGGAQLDTGVEIGAYSVINADVVIGASTRVGPHVVIRGPTRIGRDNEIFQFCSIGEQPQDKKYRGEPSKLIIGERNVIREYCTLNRGTAESLGQTTLGDDNLLMAYVHIAHDCTVGSHTVFSNGASLAGHVEVHDHVTLGGFTLVHQFCRVGRYAFSGMGSGLLKDIPPYVLVSGNPAETHGLNRVGLQRAGFDDELTGLLHRAYRDLVRASSRSRNNLEEYRSLGTRHLELRYLVEFIESSQRGITG